MPTSMRRWDEGAIQTGVANGIPINVPYLEQQTALGSIAANGKWTPIAGGSAGNGSIYFVFQTSTGTFAVNGNTGKTDFTNETPTDAASVLNAILSPATANSTPQTIFLSPEVTASTVTVNSSQKSIFSNGRTGNFGLAQTPTIGQLIFSPPLGGYVANIAFWGVQFYEIDFLASASLGYTTYVDFYNCSITTSSTDGHQGIVISGGTSLSYTQYVNFWGLNAFDGLGAGTTGLTYPTGGFITITGGSTSNSHFKFFGLNYQIVSGASGAMGLVHVVDNASTATAFDQMEFFGTDVNTLRAPSTWSAVTFDAASSSPQSLEVAYLNFGGLYLEVHTVGVTCLTAGARTSGFITAGIRIDDLSFSIGTASATLTLAENSTANWSSNQSFFEVTKTRPGSIASSATFGPGTLGEVAALPCRIGPIISTATGVTLQLATGAIIADPVNSGVLSVGGAGAWFANTTYTVGGTPLDVVVTGTVTWTSHGGTAGDILNAVAVTAAVYHLEPGQKFFVATGGTAVFVKGL